MTEGVLSRFRRNRARKGFTLVELLIVIIIIGILAGAMMLVAGGGRDSAEASKIISNLRNIKAAALMWIAENPSGLSNKDWTDLRTDPTPLNKFLDKKIAAGDHYKFITADITENNVTRTVWLLGYDLKGANVRQGVNDRLKDQAKSAGLFKDDTLAEYAGGDEVYVIVQ